MSGNTFHHVIRWNVSFSTIRVVRLRDEGSFVGSAEDPGDSGEVCCRGGATASCRFPIPHPVLLGSTASVHALQLSLAMSSPTDNIARSKLPQTTSSCLHPACERRMDTAMSRVARDRHHTAALRSVSRTTPHG